MTLTTLTGVLIGYAITKSLDIYLENEYPDKKRRIINLNEKQELPPEVEHSDVEYRLAYRKAKYDTIRATSNHSYN